MTRALSEDLTTRLFWTKQRLSQRYPPTELVKVVGDICGLHAQFATSPILSLWSRVENFTPKLLDQKLNETKELVKTWLMRGTVHIIPTSEFAIYHDSIQGHRLKLWNKFVSASKSHSLLSRLKPRIIKALSAGPMSREELHKMVPELQRIPGASWGLDVKGLAYEGKIVFAGRRGRPSKFALTDPWLGKDNPLPHPLRNAHAKLVKRYLRAYGPATKQDFRYWSGLPASTVDMAFKDIESDLETVSVGTPERKMYLLKDDLETLESLPECVGINLLPKYDPYIMGHFDKTRFLSQEYRRRIFRKAAIVEATVVSDGHAIGTWRYSTQKRNLKIDLSLFSRIPEPKQDLLHREADLLASMFGKKSVSIEVQSLSA